MKIAIAFDNYDVTVNSDKKIQTQIYNIIVNIRFKNANFRYFYTHTKRQQFLLKI